MIYVIRTYEVHAADVPAFTAAYDDGHGTGSQID